MHSFPAVIGATFVTLPGGAHSQDSYRPERVLPHARAFWESLGEL